MAHSLVIVSLLALSIHQGEAIKCYVCSSSRDQTCRDPFHTAQHESKLTHCTQDNMRNVGDIIPGVFSNFGYRTIQPEDFVCMKAVTREYDREVVVRSCTIPRADTFDVCSQLKSRELSFCQTCNTESCNGALHLAPKSLLVSLLPAAVLALLAAKY